LKAGLTTEAEELDRIKSVLKAAGSAVVSVDDLLDARHAVMILSSTLRESGHIGLGTQMSTLALKLDDLAKAELNSTSICKARQQEDDLESAVSIGQTLASELRGSKLEADAEEVGRLTDVIQHVLDGTLGSDQLEEAIKDTRTEVTKLSKLGFSAQALQLESFLRSIDGARAAQVEAASLLKQVNYMDAELAADDAELAAADGCSFLYASLMRQGLTTEARQIHAWGQLLTGSDINLKGLTKAAEECAFLMKKLKALGKIDLLMEVEDVGGLLEAALKAKVKASALHKAKEADNRMNAAVKDGTKLSECLKEGGDEAGPKLPRDSMEVQL